MHRGQGSGRRTAPQRERWGGAGQGEIDSERQEGGKKNTENDKEVEKVNAGKTDASEKQGTQRSPCCSGSMPDL